MPNGPNGTDRDDRGRWTAGNQAAAGRGNPDADRVASWRRALVDTITADDLAAVVRELVAQGSSWRAVGPSASCSTDA